MRNTHGAEGGDRGNEETATPAEIPSGRPRGGIALRTHTGGEEDGGAEGPADWRKVRLSAFDARGRRTIGADHVAPTPFAEERLPLPSPSPRRDTERARFRRYGAIERRLPRGETRLSSAWLSVEADSKGSTDNDEAATGTDGFRICRRLEDSPKIKEGRSRNVISISHAPIVALVAEDLTLTKSERHLPPFSPSSIILPARCIRDALLRQSCSRSGRVWARWRTWRAIYPRMFEIRDMPNIVHARRAIGERTESIDTSVKARSRHKAREPDNRRVIWERVMLR